jgi:hypothetical protein
MKLLAGPHDPAKVAAYTPEQLRAEALRMANNLQMTGLEYTAAILKELVKP